MDSAATAPIECKIDPLSSRPYGIALVESYIISVFDDHLAARFLENADKATDVEPGNILRVGAQARAVTLTSQEPPVGFQIFVEAKTGVPQQVRVAVNYDDGKARSVTAGPIYIAR